MKSRTKLTDWLQQVDVVTANKVLSQVDDGHHERLLEQGQHINQISDQNERKEVGFHTTKDSEKDRHIGKSNTIYTNEWCIYKESEANLCINNKSIHPQMMHKLLLQSQPQNSL